MSWETKTDYCGLADASLLQIKSATMNRTGQYLEKIGANASIKATKAYGSAASPNCEYAIVGSGTVTGKRLGTVTTVDGKKYALASIHYENAAGAEPKFTATCREIESGAADSSCSHFDIPDFAISPAEVAEILMEAFTLSGDGCELTKCSIDIECTVNVHTVNGAIVASDVHSGRARVSATIGQYGEVEPSVTASAGWDVSAPLTCSDQDSDLPEWTVTLSKPLSKSSGS